MGCSAAKNLTVEQLDFKDPSSNGVAERKEVAEDGKNRNAPTTAGSRPPTQAKNIPENILENAKVNNLQTAASGMSFEIKFDEKEDKNESLIHKHPPKRILELQDSQGSPPTLKKLQEKLEEAETRRQQILQQRIQSASSRKPLKKQEASGNVSFENDYEAQSPPHLRGQLENGHQPANPDDLAHT